VLYTCCDGRTRGHTRFFAAAALVNAALAQHFGLFAAIRAPLSLGFLSAVGTALEIDNLRYAQAISRRHTVSMLDSTLVHAEQGRVQRYVCMHQRRRPQEWESIRTELNDLLNGRYAGSFLWRWCRGVSSLSGVLLEVRRDLRGELDFANQTHRIRIGLGLIAQIRRAA
jgi:hypothetical protein